MLETLRRWLGKHLFGSVGLTSYRVSRKRMVKWPCHLSEYEAYCFVRDNTTIPIPKIYRTFYWRGRLAIEMEYLPGCEMVWGGWRKLSESQQLALVKEVAACVAQLRALKVRKPKVVSSTSGGPCREIRVASNKLFGPFPDVQDFHAFLRARFSLEESIKTFGEVVVEVHTRDYDTTFTHGDLGVQNILIRDGKLAAIIDWECAGWYPEYWEYTRAHYNHVLQPDFYQALDPHLQRYDRELEAERTLWRKFDQPLDEFDYK